MARLLGWQQENKAQTSEMLLDQASMPVSTS